MMVSFPNGMLHSNENERSPNTDNSINESHQHEAEKKSRTRVRAPHSHYPENTGRAHLYWQRKRHRGDPRRRAVTPGERGGRGFGGWSFSVS